MFGLEGKRKKAIAYYRHSAEDKQENSVPLQREQTEVFASKYDIELIHEEADEGKSGLSAARPGFERLFDEWVLNPDAPEFDYIFVLDVTRWGRFQDPDEAAYWEMQCKKRNIRVIYISRGFPKDEERLLSSLETSIGRYMAAEYSRQLSDKVWHGSMKVSEQGFSAGGTAPYGYNRVLFDENHTRVGTLKLGDHKVIANQRVTFEPAKDGTEQIVTEIFGMFVKRWHEPSTIAELLNDRGVLSATGKTWDASKVIRVLSNETYTGTRVYNKTWRRLKQKQRKNPLEEWVRCVDAFEAIVDRETFDAAQELLYWSMPTRWKYGTRKIAQTKLSLKQYITELLAGGDEDQLYQALKKVPLSLSLAYYHDGVARRCFRINEDMRHFKEVIAVSVNMFSKDQVDAIFALPTNKFGISNCMVVNDNDRSIQDFKLEADVARTKLKDICQAIKV